MTWGQGLGIVGTVVGSYFGGPVGGAIGGAIGGYIGGTFDPTLQYYGPRLEDLSVTTSTYGMDIPLLYGDGVRAAGNCIWSSGLQEAVLVKETGPGGKGGGGGTATSTYQYSVSFAVALGAGELRNLRSVWANKKLIWSVDGLDAEVDRLYAQAAAQQERADEYYDVWTSAGGTTGDGLEAAYLAAQELADDSLAAADAAAAAAVVVHAGGQPWTITSGLGLLTGPVEYLAFYPGNATQLPDPVIEAYTGAGNAPAYRHTAYIVLTLQLADWGNTQPSVDFEVNGLPYTTPAAIVGHICQASGMVQGDYSLGGGLETETVTGYAVSRASNAMAAILPLSTAFHFDILEQAGSVRFHRRGVGSSATLPLEEMGATSRKDSTSSEAPLEISRRPDYELLDEVSVTYKDEERQFQNNTQVDKRTSGNSANIRSEQLPLSLSSDKAQNIATRLLWESWGNRQGASFNVSDRWRWMHAGVIVVIPIADSLQPCRITRTTRGRNGSIACTGRIEDPYIYEGVTPGTTAIIPDPTVATVGDTIFYAFNSPILSPDESPTAFSWAADAPSPGWRAGAVYRSTDYGLTFSQIAPVPVRNTTGTVAAALPHASSDLWDRVNTITTVLRYDAHQLASVTEEQALNGYNSFWLGAADGSHGEIISAATVELLSSSPRTYRLSNLLRGRRATEHETSLHGPDEELVFLESRILRTADYGLPDFNQDRRYRGVSAYQNILDSTHEQRFFNLCERARPRAPVHAFGIRDGSNNLSMSWVRRVRAFPPIMGYDAVGLDETTEAYEVDILAGSTVVRTISASTPAASYTAAQQTADGLTPGAAVSVRIYQLSATVGRGHAGVFTL